MRSEFGVVMTIVERPDQVEWAVQRLRIVYPKVPFTIISDGLHQERYARIAEMYRGIYQQGEKLKIPVRGAEWWQRTFLAGLAMETQHVIKIDPDTSFNRTIASWPDFDCFGTVACRGSNREHVQGGVQGFQRSAIEKIVASGICLKPEFRDVEYWAWDRSSVPLLKRTKYLSTDQTLRRILLELKLQWGSWSEVRSLFGHAPQNPQKYAISHAHKWISLAERLT